MWEDVTYDPLRKWSKKHELKIFGEDDDKIEKVDYADPEGPFLSYGKYTTKTAMGEVCFHMEKQWDAAVWNAMGFPNDAKKKKAEDWVPLVTQFSAFRTTNRNLSQLRYPARKCAMHTNVLNTRDIRSYYIGCFETVGSFSPPIRKFDFL